MPVDIDTEIAQMWAGSRIIADVLKDKLPSTSQSVTIPSTGLRSGCLTSTTLAGNTQISLAGSPPVPDLAVEPHLSGSWARQTLG